MKPEKLILEMSEEADKKIRTMGIWEPSLPLTKNNQ